MKILVTDLNAYPTVPLVAVFMRGCGLRADERGVW